MGHGKLTSDDIIQAFEGFEFFIAKKTIKMGNRTFEYINEYGSGFLSTYTSMGRQPSTGTGWRPVLVYVFKFSDPYSFIYSNVRFPIFFGFLQ